ncbi:hypothetical protein [Streptomyces sp. NPDC050535]|uniref:hypothetical protein n=1 Tax=Streptomyces sp. NPDC050535 TaxID=3365626 RepID=UPI0037AB166E
MNLTRLLRRTVPVAAGCALALTLSMTPASANSGWWSSYYGGAKGYFTADGDKTTACDVKTDGYLALVQIITIRGSLLYRVADTFNDGKCTSRNASYFDLQEGATYQISVCVVKTGGTPRRCHAHDFTA